jgi:tetratricopeptide (TPR) repeat protein
MNNNTSLLKTFAAGLLSGILALVCLVPVTALAQSQAEAERAQALAFFEANNFVSALPLLEKAAAVTPNDPVILSRLGFAIYATSTTEKDAASRAKIRERARKILLKSQSVGDDSNLTKIALDALSGDDAAVVPFSNMKAAESEIRKGEEAFVRGDMDQAIAAYTHALELDPQLYEAALYAGDVEFKKAHISTDERSRNDHLEQAGRWFAKAIAIDANRETAYRYWGDALDTQGKTVEARDNFVEAIVAEPYSRKSYIGLTQWADRHQISLAHPRIDIPTNVTATKPGEISITVDGLGSKGDANDGSAAWIMYGIRRSVWMDRKDGGRSEKFAKVFPNESAYRHSLAEEAEALRGVVESVQVQRKERPAIKLTSSLENLMKLSDAGLIEAYVLFVLPDAGIARDYPDYKKSNRNKLKQYWLTMVLGEH